jgi:hypothetical protein
VFVFMCVNVWPGDEVHVEDIKVGGSIYVRMCVCVHVCSCVAGSRSAAKKTSRWGALYTRARVCGVFVCVCECAWCVCVWMWMWM